MGHSSNMMEFVRLGRTHSVRHRYLYARKSGIATIISEAENSGRWIIWTGGSNIY